MRIAVAGTGSFGKYFIDELPRAGHNIVVLTRSHKSELDGKPGVVEQRITDYASADQLTPLLTDCDALVSTILDPSPTRSPKCKRFIPSKFGSKSEEMPEPEGSVFYSNDTIRQALKKQSEVEWTVISLGCVANYVVPPANRHHRAAGDMFALDHGTKSMKIPGTGDEKFSLTSARDIAKAVAKLIKSSNKWHHFTYVQDEQTTWNEIAHVMKTAGGWTDLKIAYESVDDIEATLARKESARSTMIAELKLMVPIGLCELDQEKVQRDRAKYFPNVLWKLLKALM